MNEKTRKQWLKEHLPSGGLTTNELHYLLTSGRKNYFFICVSSTFESKPIRLTQWSALWVEVYFADIRLGLFLVCGVRWVCEIEWYA